MQTHDGWLVRVTPDLEGLTSAHLSFLARKAAQEGNGRITLTMRGNLQLRGLEERAARDFAAEASDIGLGLANPEQESRRRLIFMSPLAGRDPACASDTLALAREIQTALTSPLRNWQPPEKFGIAIDGGGLIPAGALRADFMLRHDEGIWRIHHGSQVYTPGRSKLVALLLDLLTRGASSGAERALHEAPAFSGTLPLLADAFLPGCFGVTAVLGEINATTCARLADAGGYVRVTPWRGLVLERPVEAPDLMTDPQDIRRLLVACPGEGGCHQALSRTRQHALFLAPVLAGRSLHVSGCAKGCASHGKSDVTLVAREAGYDLIWQGSTTDMPVETGLDVKDVRMRLRRVQQAGETGRKKAAHDRGEL